MSTDLKAIMRRDERHRRMINDPDLTGDLLLFVLALDEVVSTNKEHGRRTLRTWVHEVAALAYGPDSVYHRNYWARRVIGDDAPRYEAPGQRQGQYLCVAPMIRREGLCGKNSSLSLIDYDPQTGEGTCVGLCTRHRPGMEKHYDQRRREWIANGKPRPPSNAGGVLKRYFNTDWDSIYRWAGREPMEGGKEATPPRPALRLIPGGQEASS